MNRLARWMQETKTTRAELAASIGVRPSFVSRLVSPKARQRRMPGLAVALAIEAVTKGAVPVTSWGKPPRLTSLSHTRSV